MEMDLAREGTEAGLGRAYATLLLLTLLPLPAAICIKPDHLFVYFIVAHIFR